MWLKLNMASGCIFVQDLKEVLIVDTPRKTLCTKVELSSPQNAPIDEKIALASTHSDHSLH